MRDKKIGVIIIIIFLIIAISGGIFAYLFLATDTFKGKKQLFFGYAEQAIEQVEGIADSQTLEKYKDEMNKESFETDTTVNFKYSEGGEVSSGYNNLNINIKTQKENQYNYKNAQILFGDKSIVQVEGIQSENLYGIRFTNIFNQFVTLQDGKNIAGLNLTDKDLSKMKSVIEDDKDFYDGILFSKQDYQTLKEKYLQIIVDALSNGTFLKQGKSVVTIDSKAVKTNAYSCELNSLQVQNLVIKLLNELKNDDIILDKVGNLLNDTKKYEDYINNILRNAEDTEFPGMKITIYEQNKKVLRTLISVGENSVIIEKSSTSDGTYVLKVQHELLNNEKEINQQVIISKKSTDSSEKYVFNIEIVDGEDKYSIDATMDSDYKTINFELNFYKDIVNINISAKNSITDTVSQKVQLESSNNVLLNNLNADLLKSVVDKMNSAYTDTLVKRYNLLVKKLKSEDLMTALKGILSEGNFDEENGTDQPSNPTDEQVTKEEINRFNAKFEFYAGTEIPGETVKTLIDVVKDNLESVDIVQLKTQNTYDNKIKEKITLNIKKDNSNIDLANGILDKIYSEDKYNININYNSSTGIIESIVIVPSDNM